MNLKCDFLLSDVAFKFNLYQYSEEKKLAPGGKLDELETKRRWEEMKVRATAIAEDLSGGGYFAEEWANGVNEVFEPWIRSLEQTLVGSLEQTLPKPVAAKLMQFAQPYINQLVETIEAARDKLVDLGAAVTEDREQKIIAQKESIQTVIDGIKNATHDTSGGLVGKWLDDSWKALYTRFYDLEKLRKEKQEELDDERKQLVQVHEEEVASWKKKGYVYQLPGEYDRLQLYAGEIRSMGEVMLIDRIEDGVTETNLMPCGYNEFLELMTLDLTMKGEDKSRVPYKEWTRAATMQRAYKKFKGDMELIALKPEDAPKQRIVMMQILLCKLIDLIDPPDGDGDPSLVKRDFRMVPFSPVTPQQEDYLTGPRGVYKAVDTIRAQSDKLFVKDVQAVTILEKMEHIKSQERQRKEAEAEYLVSEKGEDDDAAKKALAAAQNTELDGNNEVLAKAMLSMFKHRAKQSDKAADDDTIKADIQQHVVLSNDMDTIEKFNMKAGELERLKLAKRYRNAERLLEDQRKNKSILPEYTGTLQEVTLQSKGISGKMNNGGGGGATGGLRGKKTDSTAKFRVAGIGMAFLAPRIAPEEKEL